jgi:hypothetical protein
MKIYENKLRRYQKNIVGLEKKPPGRQDDRGQRVSDFTNNQ